MTYHGYEADFNKAVDRFDFNGLYGKTILVTGATGMIGACFVDLLVYLNQNKSADINVKILARSSAKAREIFGLNADKIEIVEGDIRDIDTSLFGNHVDYIVNAASIANPATYVSNPVDTIDTSVLGIRNLLEYARQSKLERLVHVSTIEVTGSVEESLVTEESVGKIDIMNIRASYPESKRMAEMYCRSYGAQYNTDIVIARPVKTYGLYNNDSDNRAIAYMQRCIKSGSNIMLNTKAQDKYALCYVVDVATALAVLLLNAKPGDTYNIANKESYASISDIAEGLAERSGLKVEYQIVQDNKFSAIAHDVMYDSSKLESLGWLPSTSIIDGIGKLAKDTR